MPDMIKSKRFLIVCLLLVLSTVAVYWQVGSFEFLHFDDKLYITENSHVQAGLNTQNVIWAFTTVDTELWQPLLWLSFLVDYEIYGLKAGGFHVTNLILHVLSTLLLFGLMCRMTGALWRSAFVAAFFALLPVHVESVAWVAERKDVLSGVFFMLTLYLYVRYAEKPDVQKYVMVLVSFLLGLMSKSMLVTLPVMLLLLDYWPLGRLWDKYAFAPVSASETGAPNAFAGAVKEKSVRGNALPADETKTVQPSRAFIPLWQIGEKLPFFLMSLAVGIVIVKAQSGQNVVTGTAIHPFGARLANAFVSYITYIVNILAPHNLGAFYPFKEHLPVFVVVLSVFLFMILCVAAMMTVKRSPFIFVGWYWFVIILFPVIGLIPLGKHAMTDRYVYLASIGISFILAWGMPRFFKKDDLKQKILIPAGFAYIAVLSGLTWVQCGYWANDLTLFGHTLSVTQDNELMHYNISWAYLQKSDLEKAGWHLQEAIKLNPRDDRYYGNLGLVYDKMGNKTQAIAYYREGLKLNPANDLIHSNLGTTLESTGQRAEAMEHYKKAMALNPRASAPHYNYATLILDEGKTEEAEKELRTAIALNANYEDARKELAELLLKQGKTAAAIEQLREVVRINPDNAAAFYALGLAFVQESRYDEAIASFNKATLLAPNNPGAYYNLGVLYSAKGDMESAVRHFQSALAIKPDYPAARKALQNLSGNNREP